LFVLFVSHTSTLNVLINFVGDDNCGFHAVALALGKKDPDAWYQVRRDLLDELEVNGKWYIGHWGIADVDKAKACLDCKSKVAPPKHWMDLFDGIIIANAYSIIFCIVSPDGCSTYYPCFQEPIQGFDSNIFGLALINKIHFIHLELKPKVPLPPPHSMCAKYALLKPPLQLNPRFEAWSSIAPSVEEKSLHDVVHIVD